MVTRDSVTYQLTRPEGMEVSITGEGIQARGMGGICRIEELGRGQAERKAKVNCEAR